MFKGTGFCDVEIMLDEVTVLEKVEETGLQTAWIRWLPQKMKESGLTIYDFSLTQEWHSWVLCPS